MPLFQKNSFARASSVEKSVDSKIPSQSSFPAHVAPYRDAIADAFKGQSASPMFAILVGGKVTWHALGIPDNDAVIKALTSALATQ